MGLLDYFDGFKTQVSIYRGVVTIDPWGNQSSKDNWEFDHYEEGIIQPRSGSYGQANNKLTALSTHVMYCEADVDILTGDRVYYNSLKMGVDFVQATTGIGGVGSHQEISLSVADSA